MLLRLDHRRAANSARFSPNGRYIVTASADNLSRVWDAATGELKTVLRGHQGEVNSATFSPDGRWVLTASYDATAQIWEPETGAHVFTLKGHRGAVTFADFTRDGAQILTSDAGGPALVFKCDLCKPIGELVRTAPTRGRPLTTEERERYLRDAPSTAALPAGRRQ